MENTTALPPAVINGHALATVPEGSANLLPMPVQVQTIVARVNAVKAIVSQVFQVGNHFGEIPGTAKNADGTAKMVLLKPGFDALCLAFQFAPEFLKQPESIENDKMINLIYKCRIIHTPTGRVIATGDGSCNSKEEKYRWTKMSRVCPQCKGEFIRTSKPEDTQGYYCWKKLGGCGATFPKRAPEIENQPEGRKENDNPWNFHNTLTKMAQKRAGVAAIITACGLSSDFTQDMEDFEPQANDKSQRQEQGIDVQANREPDRPYYSEEFGGGYDQSDAAGAGPTNEQMDLRPSGESPQQAAPAPVNEFGGAPAFPGIADDLPPAPPNVTPEVARAYADIVKELGYCKTKDDFTKTKKLMETKGGAYIHPHVKNLVNSRYRQMFPAPTQTEKKAA